MKKYSRNCKVLLPAAALVMLFQCSHMPALGPLPQEKHATAEKTCGVSFLSRSWRFIHSIEATMPTGAKANLIGVTVADPAKRSIHCALMTLEGLVVFEARGGAELAVDKALPPLDNPAMATGLMNDIALVFFAPQGACAEKGILGKDMACRYAVKDGTVEVKVKEAGGWEIRAYDSSKRLSREVQADDINKEGIAGTISLRAPGLLGYSLLLTLIEAEKIP